MACYRPLMAYYKDVPNENGKFSLTWNIGEANLRRGIVTVACGKCVGCIGDRARELSIRCVHESKMHDDNCFVTLTYRDECLPNNGSLDKRDVQLFMKRLRKMYGKGIKFLVAGEYGGVKRRPHYHLLLFGIDFNDIESICENGKIYRQSKSLFKLWGKGYVTVGELNYATAKYVANYTIKNIGVDLEEGREKQFIIMSRGGTNGKGLGYGWYEKYSGDCFPSDYIIVGSGIKVKPPKYYFKELALTNPDLACKLKEERKNKILNSDKYLYQRRMTKEKLKKDFIKKERKKHDSKYI